MGKEKLVKYFFSHKISCLSKIQIVLCFHGNTGEFRWKDIECWSVTKPYCYWLSHRCAPWHYWIRIWINWLIRKKQGRQAYEQGAVGMRLWWNKRLLLQLYGCGKDSLWLKMTKKSNKCLKKNFKYASDWCAGPLTAKTETRPKGHFRWSFDYKLEGKQPSESQMKTVCVHGNTRVTL